MIDLIAVMEFFIAYDKKINLMWTVVSFFVRLSLLPLSEIYWFVIGIWEWFRVRDTEQCNIQFNVSHEMYMQ